MKKLFQLTYWLFFDSEEFFDLGDDGPGALSDDARAFHYTLYGLI